MPSPIWPLMEPHLNEILESIPGVVEDFEEAYDFMLPEVFPDWKPEGNLVFRVWMRALQDVTNVSMTSSYETKKNAVDALWWVFGLPHLVAKPGLLVKEPILSTKQVPKRFSIAESVWDCLDTNPYDLFALNRIDPIGAPYFTFTECCAILDVEVPVCRSKFLQVMVSNVLQ